jgi:biliverdin reductase / flavin reductase
MFHVDLPDVYPWIFRWLIRPLLGRHLDSMFIMEEYLEHECQDIDFTIVRPPQLVNTRLIGRSTSNRTFVVYRTCLEAQVCTNENNYFFPDRSTNNRMARANVARFMLDTFDNETFVRQGVAIDMPKQMI